MVNYYQILEVPQTATASEIKAAYKRLAMKFHPDHNLNNPFAEDYFKRVNEAYRVLGDMNRKYLYDAGLAIPTPSQTSQTPATYQPFTTDVPYTNDYDPKNFISVKMQKRIWIGTGVFGVLMICLGMWFYSYLNERSAEIYLAQAESLYKEHEPRQALIRISNAISHKRNCHDAYMLRAKIKQEAFNYHQAIEDYDFILNNKSFKNAQEKAKILFLKGYCYYKAYDFENALKIFEMTIAEAPKDFKYLFFKTACLIKDGRQTPELCADAMRAYHAGIKEAEELVKIYCAKPAKEKTNEAQ